MHEYSRAIILGSTGMLGERVLEKFLDSGIETIGLSRRNGFDFAQSNHAESLLWALGLSPSDLIVNCVGWIPQRASGKVTKDVQSATFSNILLPQTLEVISERTGVNVVQILTDCVFRGDSGPYDEDSRQDPEDLYGLTKRLGELGLTKTMAIRCSIVGRSKNGGSSLLDWFLNQPEGAVIEGYANHIWNGVTTDAFASLAIGLFRAGQIWPGKQHWIPRDSVTKLELLKLFREFSGRNDIFIENSQTRHSVDRRLSTTNAAKSEQLWLLAGYSQVPSIAELTKEIFEEDTI